MYQQPFFDHLQDFTSLRWTCPLLALALGATPCRNHVTIATTSHPNTPIINNAFIIHTPHWVKICRIALKIKSMHICIFGASLADCHKRHLAMFKPITPLTTKNICYLVYQGYFVKISLWLIYHEYCHTVVHWQQGLIEPQKVVDVPLLDAYSAVKLSCQCSSHHSWERVER